MESYNREQGRNLAKRATCFALSMLMTLLFCHSAKCETLSLIYDPIEGAYPPRVDLSIDTKFKVEITEHVVDEDYKEPMLHLKHKDLNLFMPLNYPAWYLTKDSEIIGQCEYASYELNESDAPEMEYKVSLENDALVIEGLGEGSAVDVYDKDGKCLYLTVDATLSLPMAEITDNEYTYICCEGFGLYIK